LVALNTRPSGVIKVPVDKQRWNGLVQSFLLSRMVQHSDRNSEHDLALAPVDETASSGKPTATTPTNDTDLATDFVIMEHSFIQGTLGRFDSATLTRARTERARH
jgi:hypothetical protein